MPLPRVPRALIERRPFLLASIAAALLFFYLHAGPWPEFYLIPIKGAALGLLAIYCWLRHGGAGGRIMAALMLVASVAEMAREVDMPAAHALFFAFYLAALFLFMRHRRQRLAGSQIGAAAALLLLPPLILYLIAGSWLGPVICAAYGLAMGGMAAAAWSSRFPRYRTGAGAVLVLSANLLSFAELGPLQGSGVPQALIWPLGYIGQMLMCIGVIQTLRAQDPQAWLDSHGRGSLH